MEEKDCKTIVGFFSNAFLLFLLKFLGRLCESYTLSEAMRRLDRLLLIYVGIYVDCDSVYELNLTEN